MGHPLPRSNFVSFFVRCLAYGFLLQGSFAGMAYTRVGVDFWKFHIFRFSFKDRSSYFSSSCLACFRSSPYLLPFTGLAILCMNQIMFYHVAGERG